MNVEISESHRHFSGLLSPLEDEKFARYFNVLIDEETGKRLERSGWYFSVRENTDEDADSSSFYRLVVKVDYDICSPTVEVVTDTQIISLSEAQIGSLDYLDIDFANITVVQSGLFNVKGKQILTQAVLKDLKAYSL